MKNPFKHFCKSRGLPDSTVHYGGDNQQSNASVAAPFPTSQSLVPAGYPTVTSGDYGYHNQPPVFEPPTAYPYGGQQLQQDTGEKEGEATWELSAGNNMNKKGKQKTGNIIVGNTSNGANIPINLPQNGRFVFTAGGNTNEGDMQEVGNIEFANVR